MMRADRFSLLLAEMTPRVSQVSRPPASGQLVADGGRRRKGLASVMATSLLGTCILAGATQASELGEASICRLLEKQIDHLCDQHGASCERVLAGFESLCSRFGTIYVSPSVAESTVLDLFREDYHIVKIEDELPTRLEATHVIVSGADLEDPVLASHLRHARNVGRTIAIVDATQAQADRFASIFGASNGANCAPASGSSRIELYGLQRTAVPALNSSYCLVGLDGLEHADSVAVRHWLGERFAFAAPAPTAGDASSGGGDDGGINIVELAVATHCSYYSQSNLQGGPAFAQDMYVTAARSFNNKEDIYYVQNGLQYDQGTSTARTYAYVVNRFAATGVRDFTSGLSQSQPTTIATFESSFSNSSSTTESGSIGFDSDGPSATAGGSATQGKTVTYNVPPTTVVNQSTDPLPAWEYVRQSAIGQTYAPQVSWLWTVPWEDYADGGEGTAGGIIFTSTMVLIDEVNQVEMRTAVPASCSVSYPFGGITEVDPPTITSVSPKTVSQGQQFTITGTNLIPGLVSAVLLRGNSISSTNFTTNGETASGTGSYTVTVIVPGDQPTGTTSVAVRQEFNDIARTSQQGPSIEVTAAE